MASTEQNELREVETEAGGTFTVRVPVNASLDAVVREARSHASLMGYSAVASVRFCKLVSSDA